MLYDQPAIPPCFTRHEFREWVNTARAAYRPENPTRSFCYDCTPEYQAQMKLEGRCIRPETEFAYVLPSDPGEDPEPSRHGLSPAAMRVLTRLKRIAEES